MPMHVFWNSLTIIWDLNWKWTLFLHLITHSLEDLYPLSKLHVVWNSNINRVTYTKSTYKDSHNSILFMDFTYLQHPRTSSFHEKIHLLLTTHFHTIVQEMSLVPRKKTSHGNVMFSWILCNIHNLYEKMQ
jgi:hypothetical protein